MPLFDLFWTMLWLFLFVAWIWLLISVYADVFRSDDMGGGKKAAWVLFVTVLPYLGVLVYLMARGSSMNERAARQAIRAQQATEDWIREVAAPRTSTADEIAKLVQLHEKGVISADQFEEQKSKLLV
ncbi:MAG: PLDc N-terminal domain-containing protein [Actinotalea sp.]|nr:PLDc N-terminal domain-containing protein [Actinotalea sp.]